MRFWFVPFVVFFVVMIFVELRNMYDEGYFVSIEEWIEKEIDKEIADESDVEFEEDENY